MPNPLPSSGPGPFELSGGDLCLDFANTWGDRPRAEADGLRSYDHLLAFARQTGLGEASDLAALEQRGRREGAAAAAALHTACELREALYALFSARARDRVLPPEALACLNAQLREALPHLAVQGSGPAPEWQWRDGAQSLTSPLWPIARAAADLLTSREAPPVRECDGAQCSWLFLDRSRGRSRRWCSMASCGNRAKARRHYHRGRPDGT